jgi:hypothetical protein
VKKRIQTMEVQKPRERREKVKKKSGGEEVK